MTPFKSITRIDYECLRSSPHWWVRVAYKKKFIKPKRFYDQDYGYDKIRSLKAAMRYRNRIEQEINKIRTERSINQVNAKGCISIYQDSMGRRRLQASVGPKRKTFSLDKYGEMEARQLGEEFIRRQREALRETFAIQQ